MLRPDLQREQYCAARMKESPFSMDRDDRLIVLRTLIQAVEHRKWTLHSAHIRTTHVHLVISTEEPASKMLGYLKARASHRLKLKQDHARRVHFWTCHGSTRYLWTSLSITAANEYVLDQQGARLAWFSSIRARSEAMG